MFRTMAVMGEEKLKLLSGQAVFDLACACGDANRVRGKNDRWIYPAAMEGGGTLYMLKVLLDNACFGDCAYCAQRAGRDTRRDRFAPEELARVFDQLVRAGRAQALFLSSGLGCSPRQTMDRMLDAVKIIRRRYGFRGFVHLKILPGAEREQVFEAARLAQRISLNLEVPGPAHLQILSHRKDFSRQIEQMKWISQAVADPRTLARGHTTQFVVGAAGESDRELVLLTDRLYQEQGLSRAYYSAFQPVAGTPLENQPPAPLLREHRLYQVDFLLRKYGYRAEEIPFQPGGQLSEQEDPKTAWARTHPDFFPLEINRAGPAELLRVPGLGPVTVKRILAARSRGSIGGPEEIGRLGAIARRAAPYLLFSGRYPVRQLSFFDSAIDNRRVAGNLEVAGGLSE